MDIPENICECLRQFLQAQSANFNAIMDNVRDQNIVAGNGAVPSHALTTPGLGAGADMSSSQLLAVFILVLLVAFLFGTATRTSKRVGAEKGSRPPPPSPPDNGGGDLIR